MGFQTKIEILKSSLIKVSSNKNQLNPYKFFLLLIFMILKRLTAPVIMTTMFSCGDLRIDKGTEKTYENCGQAAKALTSPLYDCYCFDDKSKSEYPKCKNASRK